jgi:hypothetical protein
MFTDVLDTTMEDIEHLVAMLSLGGNAFLSRALLFACDYMQRENRSRKTLMLTYKLYRLKCKRYAMRVLD